MTQIDIIWEKVLSKEQIDLLPLLRDITQTHTLIWGTAIALQLWHRKSIDYDCINNTHQWSIADFKTKVEKYGFALDKDELSAYFWSEYENQDEIHLTVNWVRLSLFNYYRTLYDDQIITIQQNSYVLWDIPSVCLEQLLCMKLFACITRNKWKDAVDIYFLLEKLELTLEYYLELCEHKYFIGIFNREAVLEQFISWNWDTTEKVDYLIDNPPSDTEIIEYLKQQSLQNI